MREMNGNDLVVDVSRPLISQLLNPSKFTHEKFT